MHFHIITLFPESFSSYIDASIIGRARDDGKIRVSFYNPRHYTDDPHHRVDQKPYGGGPGMVIQAEPVIKAVEKARGRKKDVKIIFLTPGGKQFDTTKTISYAKQYKHIIMVAGRYEGVDERVRKVFQADELTIGPYVLTGGELPAMVVLDAVSRHVPGVLGDEQSREECRSASHDVYTRPEALTHKGKTYRVPKVLLSGDHKKIDEWRTSNH